MSDAGRQDAESWHRFARTPSLGAHPAHVAALLDGAIDEDVAGRLGRSPRLAERLSGLLGRRHDLADIDAPADPADRAIALAATDEIEALCRRAGAVCWADPIAREIRASEVAALRQALGDDVYASALANREEALSPAALGMSAQEAASLGRDKIVAATREAGRRCFAAWLAIQPQGVADRVRLKLAPGAAPPEPDELYRQFGPTIIRRVAS